MKNREMFEDILWQIRKDAPRLEQEFIRLWKSGQWFI
jgi:hypothetical protein